MELINCENLNGWFVGNFKPNLVQSVNFEFGYKRIAKDTAPDFHFHKYKTEYTILLEGSILLKSSNQIIKPVSCIKYDPFEKNDQYYLEESLILIINTPSVRNDKYK